MEEFMKVALEEAQKGLDGGGYPIGAVLVIDDKIIGRAHNQQIQTGSAILHAEMACFENAGRLKPEEYKRSTLYTTLSPCDMCSGTAIYYEVPKIVIGENRTYKGPEDYLRSRGVEVVVEDSNECYELLNQFITKNPTLWKV